MYSPHQTSEEVGSNMIPYPPPLPQDGGAIVSTISSIKAFKNIVSTLQIDNYNIYLNSIRYQQNLLSSFILSTANSVRSTILADEYAIMNLEQQIQAILQKQYTYTEFDINGILGYLATNDIYGNTYALDINQSLANIEVDQQTISNNNATIRQKNAVVASDVIKLPQADYIRATTYSQYQAYYKQYTDNLSTNSILYSTYIGYNNTYNSLSSLSSLYISTINANSTLSSIIFGNPSTAMFIKYIKDLSKKSNISIRDAFQQVSSLGYIGDPSTPIVIRYMQDILNSNSNLDTLMYQIGGGDDSYDPTQYNTISHYIEPAIFIIECFAGPKLYVDLPMKQGDLYTANLQYSTLIYDIYTLSTVTIPNDSDTVNNLSSIKRGTVGIRNMHIELLRIANSTIQGVSTPIAQIQQQIDMYTMLFLSTNKQVDDMRTIYNRNYNILQYYLSRLKETSSLSMLDSTRMIENEILDLMQLTEQGVNIDEALTGVLENINRIKIPGTQAGGAYMVDLTTIYQSLQVLEGKYNDIYTKSHADRLTYEPSVTNPVDAVFESFLATYDGYIYSTIQSYDRYYGLSQQFDATKKSHTDAYAALMLRKILSTFIDSVYFSKTGDYTSTVAGLTSQIQNATMDILRYGLQLQLNESNTNDANADVTNYTNTKAKLTPAMAQMERTIQDINTKMSADLTNMKNVSTFNLSSFKTDLTPILNEEYQNAGIFDKQAYVTNRNLSTIYAYDYLNTCGILTVISSQILADFLTKRADINRQKIIEDSMQDGTTEYNYIEAKISTLNGQNSWLHDVRLDSAVNGFTQVLALTTLEYNLKLQYLDLKTYCEHQSYNRILPNPPAGEYVFNSDELKRYQYDLDLIIDSVNKTITNKKTYVDTYFQPMITSLMTYIADAGPRAELTRLIQYTETTVKDGVTTSITYTLSSILINDSPIFHLQNIPYRYVDLRSPLFTDTANIVPTTTVQTCPSTFLQSVASSDIKTRLIIIQPQMDNSVIAPAPCGTQGRYIEISKDDNNIQILQVIVIDSKGKNVAFNKGPSITPTTLYGIHTNDLPYITNGNYDYFIQSSRYGTNNKYSSDTKVLAIIDNTSIFTSPATESVGTPPKSKKITIDLGADYDITAIQYFRGSNTYSSVGLQFRILNSSNGEMAVKTLAANTDLEVLDFRINPNDSSIRCPLSIVALRKSLCGIYARYVRFYAPDGTTPGAINVESNPSPAYKFIIGQIAVIDSTGTNVAVNKSCNFITSSGSTTVTNTITNRNFSIASPSYQALPLEDCYISPAINSKTSYLEIDLGQEYDVTAVHIYNTSDTSNTTNTTYNLTKNQLGINVQIHTEDKLYATNNYTLTNNKKEVIIFQNNTANTNCKNVFEPIWPTYYGEAGVIAKSVLLTKTIATTAANTGFGFSKIEIIDKSGKDVALFKTITVSSGESTKYLPVQKRSSDFNGGDSSKCFIATTTTVNQWYKVDLLQSYEICAIKIYGCTDRLYYTNSIKIDVFDTTGNIILTRSLKGGRVLEKFDIRYNPEESAYPTDANTVLKIGDVVTFGTLADTVIFPWLLDKDDEYLAITDGNGRNMMKNLRRPIITETTLNRTIVEFGYMADVTAVIVKTNNGSSSSNGTTTLNSTVSGKRIQLYDCNGILVNDNSLTTLSFASCPQSLNVPTTTTISNVLYADFRNTLNTNICYAPIYPFKTPTTTPPGFFGKGIPTQYIRVIPKDTTTPMYISQIIAVDSNGTNVAFEKDTFTNTTDSVLLNSTKNAVDGVYEANLGDSDFLTLFFMKYRQKSTSRSFVSQVGVQDDKFWIVDLKTECEINSVIYVASDGYNKISQGVIVQLYDKNLNLVGVQQVSNLISIFGVDILDFRIDRTESYQNPNTRLEVRERQVSTGPSLCGVMAQYIRIELKPSNLLPTGSDKIIQLSQIVALDSLGNNIALYKSAYYNGSSDVAVTVSRVVDGKYYMRGLVTLPKGTSPSQVSTGFISNPLDSNPYIEINIGSEAEIVNLYLINMKENQARLNNMRLKIYNKQRDIIIMQDLSYSTSAIPDVHYVQTTNTPPNKIITTFQNIAPTPINVIGVQIRQDLMKLKVGQGLAAEGVFAPQTVSDSVTPTPTGTTTTGLTALQSCFPQLTIQSRFIRDTVSKGIPNCRKIRISNPNQYIQISQIMAYTPDGKNVALRKSCIATSVLPGFYASKITDGIGGYFHTRRSENECYISAKGRYDYVDIDLGAEYTIIAVKYVPPNTNYYRNIGLIVQLIKVTSGNDIVMAQDVIESDYIGGKTIDFRPLNTSPPISQLIMPQIYTSAITFVPQP